MTGAANDLDNVEAMAAVGRQAVATGPDGEPLGDLLRSAHGIQERAFVHENGQVTITRWVLATGGRWSVAHVFTMPMEAALNLAAILAELVHQQGGPLTV